MKNLQYFYAIILFACLWQPAVAQNTLSGTVSSKVGNTKLPGVSVFIPVLKLGSITDSAGHYSFDNVQKGTWKVEFISLGFDTLFKTVNVVSSNVVLNVQLYSSMTQIQEVVVSGGYVTTARQTPVQINKISANALTQSGGTTLMASLANQPGVSSVSTGNYAGKPVIRGLSYDRVLVVDQGMPVSNQQWGDEHGLSLNGLGVGDVELVKGPASLLYGSGAMGGVINLVPEKPAKEGTVEGDAGVTLYSNTAGEKADMFVKGSGKVFNWDVGSSYEEQGDYLTGNGIRATNSNFNELSGLAGIGIHTTKVISSLSWNYSHTLLGIPDPTALDSSEKVAVHTIYPSHQELSNTFLSSQTTFFFGNSKLKVDLGYEHNLRSEIDPDVFNNEVTGLGLELKTFNYDAKWFSNDNSNSQIIVGVQGMVQSNHNFGFEYLIPDANVQQESIYGLYRYKHKKWIFEGGLRYQINQVTGIKTGVPDSIDYHPAFKVNYGSPNGAFGATYNATNALTFKANIASGFRSPNLSELSANGVHEGTFEYQIGNLNLKTEQNVEFDYSVMVSTKAVNTQLDLFYNLFSNYIYLSPTSDSIYGYQVYKYAQQNAALYGGEYTLDIHPNPVSWLHYIPTASVVFEKAADGTYLPFTPPAKIVNELRADLVHSKSIQDGYVFFKVNSVFAQNDVAMFEVPTPGYTLLDAGIGGQIKFDNCKLHIDIVGTNLANVAYINNLSRLIADPIAKSLYNMGRNITASVKLEF